MWQKKYNGLSLDQYLQLDTVKDIDQIIKYNKELLTDYPFLQVIKSMYSIDFPFAPTFGEDYFVRTFLDDIPVGWRINFIEDLLKELVTDLKANNIQNYEIIQVKEKFGGLRWYDSGGSQKWNQEILPKYEEMSYYTCGICGKPASYISKGWIFPWCEDCALKRLDKDNKTFGEEIDLVQMFDKIKDL